MPEIKENFFRAKPVAVSMPLILWMNDSAYRRDYGRWLYENFNLLVAEFKKHGRFLTLKETEDSIL